MQTEAIETVQNINQLLFDKYGQTEFDFSYSSNGYYEAICVNEMTLWLSNSDDRLFDEDKNEYEPLEPFIIKKWNELVTKFYNTQL